MFHEFKEVPYHLLGPWRNKWGYITAIAQFDEDDIILKSQTPYGDNLIRRFFDWEDCEKMVDLLEQDRRF